MSGEHFVPDVSHARKEEVYEVSEDTLLLADSIEKDALFIRRLKPTFCLEIGCGSGYVSAVLAHTLENRAVCFATDINPSAALATSVTLRKNAPQHGLLSPHLWLPLLSLESRVCCACLGLGGGGGADQHE